MLEWEAPPTFSASSAWGGSTLLSAAKLNVLTRNMEWLTGRADGEKMVFAGVKHDQFPGSDLEKVIWEGHIRHQKDRLRFGFWWTSDKAETYVSMSYGGNDMGSSQIGVGASIFYTGSLDLSGLSLTAGSWYDVYFAHQLVGDPTNTAFQLAWIAEYEGYNISGLWKTPPTFTDSAMTDLSGSLTTLSTNASKLKDVAIGPIASFAAPGLAGDDWSEAWKDLRYEEDSEYDSSDDIYWGGGCIQPGAVSKLRYVFKAATDTKLRFKYQSADGVWDSDYLPTAAGILFSTSGIYDGIIDVSGCAAQGDYVRIRAQIREGDEDIDHTGVSLYYLSVYSEEDYSAATLPTWEHGNMVVEAASMNRYSARQTALAASGKLLKYQNQAMKRVGASDGGEEGGRIGILRRNGSRYLHYMARTGHEAPAIKYFGSATTGSIVEERSYHLETGWNTPYTLNVEQLDQLYPGTYYNADEVTRAQEWDDA